MGKNKKVQIRLYPHSDRYKQVEYRIEPTELNWFQRIFCNCWSVIYKFSYIGGKPDKSDFIPLLDKPGTINHYKDKFKTLKDIEDFEQEQLKKYNNVLYLFIKIIEKYSIIYKTILLKHNKK